MADEKMVNEELYQKFFAIVGEGKKVSQNQVAKEMGISPGAISLYKNGTYNGNITILEKKIQGFLGREGRRVSNITIPIAETTTIENIRVAVEMAHDYRDITVIVGEAGCGKTTAIRRYEAENPGAAIVIYVLQEITISKLLALIADAIGVYGKGGTKTMLIDRIVAELKGRDMVLIIDQADYLPDRALELLRCITVDMAEVGLVLVGMPRLEMQLRNLRNDHEQLLSRVGTFLKVERLRAGDAEKIIRGVWESASDEVIKGITKLASGSMRTLAKLIERTHRIMVVYRQEVPTYDMVISAKDLSMR